MKRLLVLILLAFPALTSAQELHTFSNGEVADAEKINENLNLLLKKIDALEEQVAVAEPEPEPESQLPFPTGSCSGLIPGDDAVLLDAIKGEGEPVRGIGSAAIVFDFDNSTVSGEFVFFIEPESDNEAYPRWSFDQDDSGIDLSIERDANFPASFSVTFQVDTPKGGVEYDFINLPRTGNVHTSEIQSVRVMPVNGGATFILQADNFHGVCQAH